MRPWGGIAARLYRLQEPLETAAVQAAVSVAEPAADDRVLDVATGTGVALSRLADLPRPPCAAVGVDSSIDMLRAAPRLPDGYELREGDARSLPFDDDSFELVFAAYLLHLLDGEDRRRVLSEMARVLAPGGRVVTVTVWHPRPGARRLLAAMPASTGLRPHDPRDELEDAGLHPTAREVTLRGYPSLVVRAAAAAGPPDYRAI